MLLRTASYYVVLCCVSVVFNFAYFFEFRYWLLVFCLLFELIWGKCLRALEGLWRVVHVK